MRLLNPYQDISGKVRKKTITHEHIVSQATLESCLNRGIDVLCAVTYNPAVPQYPITCWSNEYQDYARYEEDAENLEIITKTFTGAYSEFTKSNGEPANLSELVQLPNAEHAFARFNGRVYPSIHLNFVGNMWGDPVNGPLADLPEGTTPGAYRIAHPLYTWEQVFTNVAANLPFNKVFGTFNHPGWTFRRLGESFKFGDAEELIKKSSGLIKAIELWCNADSVAGHNINIEFYDWLLLRGHQLWMSSTVDWQGDFEDEPYNTSGLDLGCDVLLLPVGYESLTYEQKQIACLDAFINGSFYGAGLGDIDIDSVTIDGGNVTIKFSETMTDIVVDIDGKRGAFHNTDTAFATMGNNNCFVRFEAVKGNEFVYTNPIFNLDYKPETNIDKYMTLLFRP